MWNPEGELAKFVQFQKDVADMKADTLKEELKKWNCKKFVESGFVRANLTSNKGCYVKGFSGIMDVFRKPVILFSFEDYSDSPLFDESMNNLKQDEG